MKIRWLLPVVLTALLSACAPDPVEPAAGSSPPATDRDAVPSSTETAAPDPYDY